MNDHFRINGKSASKEDFTALRKLFEEAGYQTEEAFRDDNVTAGEIDGYLDTDRNGRFNSKDLAQGIFRQSVLTWKLTNILNAYDYKIYEHLTDKADLFAAFQTYTSNNLTPKAFTGRPVKPEEWSLREKRHGLGLAIRYTWIINEQTFPVPLRGEPSFILDLLGNNGDDPSFVKAVMAHVHPELKKDLKFMTACIQLRPESFEEADESLGNNKSFILSLLERSLKVFEFLPEPFKKDPDIFQSAKKGAKRLLMSGGPHAFFNFPIDLQNDPDLFLLAFEKDPEMVRFSNLMPLFALPDLSPRIIQAVAEKTEAIFALRPELANDKQSVLDALRKYKGRVFPYLYGSSLRTNKEVMLEAVSIDGLVLGWGGPFVHDRDVVKAAVRSNGLALGVAKDFQADEEIVSLALNNTPWALKFVSPEYLIKIRDKVKRAVFQDSLLLEFAGPYRGDREIVTEAITRDPSTFRFADETLRDDPQMVRFAMHKDFRTLRDAGPKAKRDLALFKEAIDIHPANLTYAEYPVTANKELVLKAVSRIGRLLEFADKSLKRDPDVVVAAMKNNRTAIEFVEPGAFQFPKVYQLAIRQNNLWHFSEFANNLLWEEKIARLRAKGIEFPSEMTRSYLSFEEGLRKLNIDFPQRFEQVRTLAEVVWNRLNPFDSGDRRPMALLMYPKEDWNKAFQRDRWWRPFTPSPIDMIVATRKYRVLYFENAKDTEVQRIIEEIKEEGRKVRGLLLAGHGTAKTLALGGVDLRIHYSTQEEQDGALRKQEELYVDVWDFKGGKFKALRNIMEEGSWIVTESCSNGQGQIKADNLTNVIHEEVPQSHVFSAQDPSAFRSFKFDANDLPVIKYWGSSPYNIRSVGDNR